MARTPRVKVDFTVPADFDVEAFTALLANRLEPRARAFDRMAPRTDGMVLDAAFADEDDARSFLWWLESRLGHTGGPTGRITWHLCSHAMGEQATEPCDQAPEYVVIQDGP